MKIYSIYDKEFKEFGHVVKENVSEILKVLATKECPENTIYVPSDKELEATNDAKEIMINSFGGLPIQVGYCNGHNDMLNCLEYHFSNEINIMESDTILLLARMADVDENNHIDSSLVKAFKVPAGVGVVLYSTALHYAPCGVDGNGFRAAVVLPKGTNYDKPANAKCTLLWGSNKWLIAHKDTNEAKQGAFVGIDGVNIKL